MPYHITLGDGLKFFVARHTDKICGQCGKIAETFTYGKHTLKPSKRKRGAR